MTYDFERLQENLIFLQDYRYLSITDIRITKGDLQAFDTTAFFRSLMSHRVYRDNYCGRGSYERTEAPIHGPYWIEHIQLDHFRELPFSDLRGAFCNRVDDPEWIDCCGMVSPSTRYEIIAFLESLPAEETLCFELDLDQQENKDLWWEIPCSGDFREYPLVVVSDRLLQLCVFTDD